jgi:tight adherence protein B
MSRELGQAGVALRVGEYLLIRLVCLIGFGLAGWLVLQRLGVEGFGFEAVTTLAFAVAGWLLPRIYISRKRQSRLQRIEAQLPDALTAIAKSLRAGSGILQGLAFAAHETPAPLGPELQSALRDLRLGAEAEDVFASLSERVGSHDLDIAVTAIDIQRTVGGNLAEILTNVTNTIRERAALQREIRVLTAQQRLTTNLISLIPVAVAGAFIAINPELGDLLIHTTPGQIALGVGIALELIGVMAVSRLARIDV